MANDIDMWNDIEELEKGTKTDKDMAKDLLDCHRAKYQDGDEKRADELKQLFTKKYGGWNNYY